MALITSGCYQRVKERVALPEYIAAQGLPTLSQRRCATPTTWTIFQLDGPNHIGGLW